MPGVIVALVLAAFGVQHRFETVAPAGAGQYDTPVDVAADAQGFVYVLFRPFVQKYDPNGTLVATWGGWGPADGQFAEPDAYRLSPSALDVDGLGHVYVADNDGDRVVKFMTDGDFVANWEGFEEPVVLRSDSDDNVYVGDAPDFLGTTYRPAMLRKLSPGGTVLAARSVSHPYPFATAPGGRLYRAEAVELVGRIDPEAVAGTGPERSGGFELEFGDRPYRASQTPSCCGVAFLDGRIWVARSVIATLEAYGPEGGLVAACPLPGYTRSVAAGRDGRLYVLNGRTVLRLGEASEPCDTEPPAVTSMRLSRHVLRVSSYRRLRKATLHFGTSEQGTAELTFTRLVEGRRKRGRCRRPSRGNRGRRPCVRRRVAEATFDGIRAYLNQGGGVRFVNLLWSERLPAGRYEIEVTVTDRAGLRSAPAIAEVRVTP